MSKNISTNIFSEIGKLEGVIVHTPGHEVENMTPQNVERALYSDILNLSVATKEYNQLKFVLDKLSRTYEVKDLLKAVLKNEKVKEHLIKKVCKNEDVINLKEYLLGLNEDELARQLIEGVPLQKNTLTNFLSKERYSLKPLHNFFYTRDATVPVFDNVFIGRMASGVRQRETLIMETIFDFHPSFSTKTYNASVIDPGNLNIAIEGGDLLVARDDIILMGIGARTTSQGVDFLLENIKNKKEKIHLIIQELPLTPESFIHLDMVFTLLDKDTCMIYEPVIMKMNKFHTVHIYAEGGKVKYIREEKNMLQALEKAGMSLNPLYCGGRKDQWAQEREQWHSGANFFAVAPGKVIGYARNTHTVEELSQNEYEIIRANDIIKERVNPDDYKKYLITLDGSELPRGGGGARCMTMPVCRKPVEW